MNIHADPAHPSGMRKALLIGCAIAGLCAAASRVGAQAFNATPKTVSGGVTYNRATPGIETVIVDTPNAIINWTPNVGGNPIVFLPQGNTATFTNGPSNSDFAVLNRVIANVPIRFDGHVISTIQNFALGTSSPGGTVIFYSPTGIIIGSTATFDVGNLVLTTLNVVDDGTGTFYDPAAPGLFFNNGAANPNAAVLTEAGAQINAPAQGSYVAFVAPRIVHGGSVRVNGVAAYVAGEQVQMRVNQGLFDIIVDVGSDNPSPIVHTGSTGGPASTGAADVHAVYMVAVPKNQAITAILEGNIGFDPAVNAAVENGVIVLSAGFNLSGGQVDRYGDFVPVPKPVGGASIELRGGTVSSDLFGYATTDVLAGATNSNLAFQQDVSLFAGRRAHLFANNGLALSVGGNALVSAERSRSADPMAFDLAGGEALIFSTKSGTVTIVGNATVDASGRGRVDGALSHAGNGTGGTAGIFADTGSVQIGGNATVLATGNGATIDFAPDTGGVGKGGTTLVEGRNGGNVQIAGTLGMDASGIASRTSGATPGAGAQGAGGTVSVSATNNGAVSVTGAATLTSIGAGGNVLSGPGNSGGTGTGGTISILAGGTVTFTSAVNVAANGTGGLGPRGGDGIGGTINILATAGQIGFQGDLDIDADGTGADANAAGGRGGDGTGGNVLVSARSSAALSRVTGGAIDISVRGTGGAGGSALIGTPAGRGGDGRGGNAAMLAEAANGTLQFGAVIAASNGLGGRGGFADFEGGGGRGGDGFGGDVRIGTIAGAAAPVQPGSARFASAALSATGQGGQGGNGQGVGGNGAGGSTRLLASGAVATITGNATLTADATGGTGGDAAIAGNPGGVLGQASGGQIILAAGPGGTLSAGNVTGTANATGAVNNGNAPGQWHVTAATGGAVNLANLTLGAAANGTPATRPFSSLEPQGGTINVTQIAALSTQGEIRVIADAAGRITGGTLGLTAGDDVTMSHTNPGPTGLTVDVTNFNVVAGDDFTAGAGVVTRSAAATDIRAADLATVSGRVLGANILIASNDIDIGGGIGDAGTQTVTLLPNTTGQFVLLGGAAQGPGYTVTGAEAGRVRAGTLRIVAPGLGASPSLVVRDLTVNGGGAAAGLGRLDLVTDGIARVEGALLMAGAGATDGISINARQRIEVPTPTGSIRVRDGTGAPAGNLLLVSNNIWIASQGIIDQLRLDPNYAGRDADLLDNGGIDAQRGYVEAGGMVIRTGGTLFVQNSGLPLNPAFGGLTSGAAGLTIQPTGVAPVVVTAFGRRVNTDGSVVPGVPFFFQVNFQAGPGYTAGSTFNTCIIVTRQCGAAGGPVIQPAGPDPITGPVGGSASIGLPLGAEQDDLVDTSFSSDPLIEEPVTSGGESTLWECDRNHDGKCDDQDR